MDLVEYFDGSRTPIELWWFVNQLPKNSRYWAARSRDVELYQLALERGYAARRSPPPEMYEYSPEVEVQAALFHQLQQIAYLVANQNTPKRKRRRFKPVRWPVPLTAADIARREQARAARRHLDSVVRFVPDDQWLAEQAEHAQNGPGPLTRDR